MSAPAFHRLSARDQLRLPVWAGRLLPGLLRYGVPLREGWALAYHCALLWRAMDRSCRPRTAAGLLRRYPLAELAAMVRQYWADCSWEEGGHVDGI